MCDWTCLQQARVDTDARVSGVLGCWQRRLHAPRRCSASMKVTSACRAVAVQQGANAGGGLPQSELPTAYVQDMLMTDPVHALGLRVTRAPGATLEFVSLEEAKTELRARPLPTALWCTAPGCCYVWHR